ncbi:MAG: DNA-methyltransferase [Bacillota bacterium]|jgi:site-specific DNA-methyltransferase (adenine-specific)
MAKQIAYNMDCMEAMREMPDKAFELAIVDPPYGIGESGEKNHTRTKLAKAQNYKAFAGNDKEPPSAEYFAELFRVSKNQIVWGANHFISRIPYDSSCWIVWDKMNGENDFADCELAWTSFPKAVRQFTFRWAGMLQGNMANKEIRIHPAQKPVALYEWLLTHYAKPGDKILDTHLGSGSSRIAAYNLGFDFVGYEIDKDYFEAQEERFRVHTAQVRLIDTTPTEAEQITL